MSTDNASAASSHLELTGNTSHALGFAGENVWPVIAAIWDQHGIEARWIDGKLGVQVLGMGLWVQEFGQVTGVSEELASVAPLDMVA